MYFPLKKTGDFFMANLSLWQWKDEFFASSLVSFKKKLCRLQVTEESLRGDDFPWRSFKLRHTLTTVQRGRLKAWTSTIFCFKNCQRKLMRKFLRWKKTKQQRPMIFTHSPKVEFILRVFCENTGFLCFSRFSRSITIEEEGMMNF